MLKKRFVISEGFIDVHHDNKIAAIEKLSYHIACIRILGSMEYVTTRNYSFLENSWKIF